MSGKLVPLVIAGLSLALSLPVTPAEARRNTDKAGTVSSEVTEALLGLSVRAKLVDKLGGSAVRIGVSVTGDRATLTGTVPKKETQEMAKEVALSVPGIANVDNQVKESTPASAMTHATSEVKDAGLEIKVKTLLLKEIGMSALSITVESTDGVVSLRGQLDDATSKTAARKTRKINGVKKVVNLLRV